MKAKEMFEKLGYKQENWCFDDENKIDEIIYLREKRFSSNITFSLDDKCFKIHRKNENKAGWCDMNMFRAINQQCKELGWIEDK